MTWWVLLIKAVLILQVYIIYIVVVVVILFPGYGNQMLTGQLVVISSVLFFAIASYAILLSPFLPLTGFLVCPLVKYRLFSDPFLSRSWMS